MLGPLLKISYNPAAVTDWRRILTTVIVHVPKRWCQRMEFVNRLMGFWAWLDLYQHDGVPTVALIRITHHLIFRNKWLT